jgi:small subunit ribosomal protein S21
MVSWSGVCLPGACASVSSSCPARYKDYDRRVRRIAPTAICREESDCSSSRFHTPRVLVEVHTGIDDNLLSMARFKRKVQTEDIIKEVKRHSYYLKPGERKRVKQALAQKRARKKIRKERD